MTIDECQYSFRDLAEKRLPGLISEMKAALCKTMQMSQFAENGVGKKSILKELEKTLTSKVAMYWAMKMGLCM